MKRIISWNVNGIRAAEKKGFVQWLASSGADVVCVQETKANPGQLSAQLLSPEYGGGFYSSFWACARRPGYSGTAVYAKVRPDEVDVMGIPEFDDEGRVLVARFGVLAVISAYFPNSQDGGARLGYKLDFCRAMREFCDGLVAQGTDVVLCGDYNIAHKPVDLANPKANEGNPGYLPEERAWMDEFTGGGWCDTFRHFCCEPGQYTWWSYRSRARERNIGWRIDYQCVNRSLLPKVRASRIMADVTGSDHCPVVLELED